MVSKLQYLMQEHLEYIITLNYPYRMTQYLGRSKRPLSQWIWAVREPPPPGPCPAALAASPSVASPPAALLAPAGTCCPRQQRVQGTGSPARGVGISSRNTLSTPTASTRNGIICTWRRNWQQEHVVRANSQHKEREFMEFGLVCCNIINYRHWFWEK